MHSLVTGASGYIGAPLVAALAGAGHRVCAQVNRGVVPPEAQQDLRCDLTVGIPGTALIGIDTLYHLAGIAHRSAAEADYQRVNVRATLRLAEEAALRGVRRFVFLSSSKAAHAEREHRESGGADRYASSKWQAEQGLRDIVTGTAMELVVLRPALVYAMPPTGNLRLLQRWAALRLPSPPVGGARPMVARDDLLQLLLALGAQPLNTPLTLTACDGEAYSTRRLHRAFCAAAGRSPLLPSPPPGLWRLAARGLDLLRGRPRGTHWQLLAAEESCRGSDVTAICDHWPRWCFEDYLQHDGAAR